MSGSMDPSAVAEAIAKFDGSLLHSDKILANKKEEEFLPEEYREHLKGKRKPSNWYAGDQKPDPGR